MALTDVSDVFAAAHEDGFNRIIHHVMRQRPSLFHYGTRAFVERPSLLCCPPEDVHPEVIKRMNPLVSPMPYLSIPGYSGPYGIEYNFSLEKLAIDFEPSSVFSLPPELGPVLPAQTFALKAVVCGGIACPDQKYLDEVKVDLEPYRPNKQIGKRGSTLQGNEQPQPSLPEPPKIGLPFTPRSVLCFHLEVYVILHFEREFFNGEPVLSMKLDKLELVDIKPDGLESSMECFLRTTLRLGILPHLRIAFNSLALTLGDFISIVPTPISATVPFNPAIAKDMVSIRLDLQTP